MHLTSPHSLQMQLDVEKIIFKILWREQVSFFSKPQAKKIRRITVTANYDFCLLLTNTSGFVLDKKYTIQFY